MQARGYVIFGDIPPILVQNHLSLRSGDTIQLNQTHLSAYDRNNNNNTIRFVPSNITHGYFEFIINLESPSLISLNRNYSMAACSLFMMAVSLHRVIISRCIVQGLPGPALRPPILLSFHNYNIQRLNIYANTSPPDYDTYVTPT